MLYDVLAPLLFFASLGGILLIISRVVIRIRRTELEATVSAVGAATAPASSAEVSALLKPTQKGVHVITNRLAYTAAAVRALPGDARRYLHRRREQRALAAEAAAESPQDETQPVLAESAVITAPPEKRRLAALAFWRRRQERRAEAPSDIAAAEAEPAESPRTSIRRRWRTRRVEQTEQAVAAPAVEAARSNEVPVTPVAAAVSVPAAPMMKALSRSRRATLLRAVQHDTPRQPVARTPLERARQALGEAHYDTAEKLLVPYIMKHPKDPTAYMLLGAAAEGRGQWAEAMQIYEQVIACNADEQGAYAALGHAAYRSGRFGRALQALQRAHEAAPMDESILAELLSIAQKMDNRALQHSISEKLDACRAEAHDEHPDKKSRPAVRANAAHLPVRRASTLERVGK